MRTGTLKKTTVWSICHYFPTGSRKQAMQTVFLTYIVLCKLKMSELHPTRIASASLCLQFNIISHSSSSFGMDYAIAYLQSSTHLRCIATACFWYGLQYTESANPLAVLSRVGMNHSADEEWWMNDGWLWFMIDYEWLMMNHDCATYYQHEHFPWFSKLIDVSFMT